MAKWIGGNSEFGGGVKTSADLVIQEIGSKLGYGIQIKNSMTLTDATSFSDFVLTDTGNSVFATQLINFGIDPSIVKDLEDIFMMKGFNIAYHKVGTDKYVKGAPKGEKADVYLGTYGHLLELVE